MDRGIKNNEHFRYVIWITIAFFLTHGLILLLSGTWWDEKTWSFSEPELMWNISLQLGKPAAFFLMKFIFTIPEVLARALIVLCFYLSTLGIFFLYNQIPGIKEKDALLMTLLYVAIPANDARALRGVFPYTFGYFLFVTAFYVLLILQKKYQYRNLPLRILILILFALSFAFLNSNLVFYALPLLNILFYIIKNRIKAIYRFFDFAILPFIYYVLKNTLFPPYGVYEDYNSVTLKGLVKGIIHSARVCFLRLVDILTSWFNYRYVWIIMLVVMSGAFFAMWQKQRSNKNGVVSSSVRLKIKMLKEMIPLLLIGCVVMWLGAYAYVVIGQECTLTGVGGRSSILLGAGAAVILFALITWIPYDWMKETVCMAIIICGALHFNSYYLAYQEDYFRQMDLVYEMKEYYDVLQDTKNILYLTNTEPIVNATRFYTLNSNGSEVFGDQSHFFMNGKRDIEYLQDDSNLALERFVFDGDYQMADYEIGRSTDVEAILIYENDLSIWDTMSLRLTELFDDQSFKRELYRDRNLQVYTRGMKEYEEIKGICIQ